MHAVSAVWDVRPTKARKQHTCTACRRPIYAGTVYDRIGSFYDAWSTYRVHTDCHALARELGAEAVMYGDGYSVHDLREQCREASAAREWLRILRARHREQLAQVPK